MKRGDFIEAGLITYEWYADQKRRCKWVVGHNAMFLAHQCRFSNVPLLVVDGEVAIVVDPATDLLVERPEPLNTWKGRQTPAPNCRWTRLYQSVYPFPVTADKNKYGYPKSSVMSAIDRMGLKPFPRKVRFSHVVGCIWVRVESWQINFLQCEDHPDVQPEDEAWPLFVPQTLDLEAMCEAEIPNREADEDICAKDGHEISQVLQTLVGYESHTRYCPPSSCLTYLRETFHCTEKYLKWVWWGVPFEEWVHAFDDAPEIDELCLFIIANAASMTIVINVSASICPFLVSVANHRILFRENYALGLPVRGGETTAPMSRLSLCWLIPVGGGGRPGRFGWGQTIQLDACGSKTTGCTQQPYCEALWGAQCPPAQPIAAALSGSLKKGNYHSNLKNTVLLHQASKWEK